MASGLFFRHCDGVYKNLKGEKLVVGEDETGKKRKREDEKEEGN